MIDVNVIFALRSSVSDLDFDDKIPYRSGCLGITPNRAG
jgi:hypothetical protein